MSYGFTLFQRAHSHGQSLYQSEYRFFYFFTQERYWLGNSTPLEGVISYNNNILYTKYLLYAQYTVYLQQNQQRDLMHSSYVLHYVYVSINTQLLTKKISMYLVTPVHMHFYAFIQWANHMAASRGIKHCRKRVLIVARFLVPDRPVLFRNCWCAGIFVHSFL